MPHIIDFYLISLRYTIPYVSVLTKPVDRAGRKTLKGHRGDEPMAHSEQHYRAAAQGLGEGFLGSAFDRSSLPDSDVSKIHTIAAFREEAELMGLKGGSVAGVQERGMRLSRSIQDAKSAESEKAKRSMDNILFLDLLDQHIADLDRIMDETRAKLTEQYGEEWAEELALEILDLSLIHI